MFRDLLFDDLKEYLKLDDKTLNTKLVASHQSVVDHWLAEAPKTSEAREAFYEKTDTYLLELSAWILQFEGRAAWNQQVHEFAKKLNLKTALDFGGGISNEGLQLAQDGLSVHLCEISPASRNFALWRADKHNFRERFTLVEGDKLQRYDLCILLDVIGHLEDPETVIIDLARHAQYLFYTSDFQLPPPQNYWPMHNDKPANFDRVFEGVWRPLSGGFYESRLYRPKFSLSPSLKDFGSGEGGVKRQVEALTRLLPTYGFDIVPSDQADFAHAHATGDHPRTLVYTSHGFYPWRTANVMEKHINSILKQSISAAKRVISVSDEAKTIIEERLKQPVTIIRNGTFLEDLDAVPYSEFRKRSQISGPFFLWAKNSVEGVCDPTPAMELARLLPQYTFVFTRIIDGSKVPPNVRVIGTQPYARMLEAIRDCDVYLGTTKEQFSVQTLEAMGMGKPVLCFPEGGNGKVVSHQSDGFIAQETADLVKGAQYCLQNKERLGKAARAKIEREYTWQKIVPQIVKLYWEAIEEYIADLRRPLLSIVIPHYNLMQFLPETIDSALAQTIESKEIIVVDDGSIQDITPIIEAYTPLGVRFIRQQNSRVAAARNRGIAASTGRYVCCLDADDKLDPSFGEKLTLSLEADWRTGIAYTDFQLFGDARGHIRGIEYDFEKLKEGNFVPCANVFRREAWGRTGGYKDINPSWEDYELWLNMGKMGFVGKHLAEPLFHYRKRKNQGRDFSSHGHEARLRALVNSHHPDLYTPKVSVIIPTYKHTHYLPDALRSLEWQTFTDFEVIVVDDGNDDADQIEKIGTFFRTKFPITILHHEQNRGLAAARNTGCAAARGEIFLTLDADDKIKPTFLESTIAVLDQRPDIAIVYTDIEMFNDRMNKIFEMPDYDYDELLRRNLMACASPYRREVWEKVGGYDGRMVYGWEDYLFWIKAGRLGFCGVRLPEPLFMYRREGETMILRAFNHTKEMSKQLREYVPDVFRGERPMGCCGRTRLNYGAKPATMRRGFVGQTANASVGEYPLVKLYYKSPKPIFVLTSVTRTPLRLPGPQEIWVDPRDTPQLLSRGDFEYAEMLEEVLA